MKAAFDRLFRSNHSAILKVAGAGIVGLLIAFRVVHLQRNRIPHKGAVLALIVTPLLTMLLTMALIRADTVRGQLAAGHPMGVVSRILFGAGIWSLLLWVIGLLLAGFPLAIWIGNLTWHRPAG